MDNVNETSIDEDVVKRESNARTKANQTLEQNGQRKRQKRESKARKSACKATAAPAQSSSSTNDTNFIIPLSLNTKMTSYHGTKECFSSWFK
jgi:3-polyprenyl-4-hydroxybenzoate decarboxylase